MIALAIRDRIQLARLASQEASQRKKTHPLGVLGERCRLAGLKGVLVRNVRGNSAWGRKLLAAKLAKKRWAKARARGVQSVNGEAD